MWKAAVHYTMRAIELARWDAIGSDPWSTHAVLTALEEGGVRGLRLRAVTLEDESGRWVAAAPVATLPIDAGRLTHGLFRGVIEGARKIQPRFLHTSIMLCGTPLSVGNPPARIATGVPGARAYAELGRALERLAHEERVAWRAFKEIPAGELAVAERALGPSGWILAPSEPNMALDVPWEDYREYVASLRSHYRYKVRLAERRRRDVGVEVDWVPLAEGYGPDAHALYETVLARAPVQLERLTMDFFQSFARSYPDETWMIRFRKGGTLVGWVAVLVRDRVATDLVHGIDDAAAQDSALYFNQLAETIRFAIARRARALVLGQSSETAKARFGARPVPLWIAVRHRNPFVNAPLRAGRGLLFEEKHVPARHVFAPGGADAAAHEARTGP